MLKVCIFYICIEFPHLGKKHIKKKVPSARAGGSKSTFDPGFRFQKKSRKGSKWLSATIVTL